MARPGPGLSKEAANQKWKTMFNDMNVKRDQRDAVNEDGKPIGKARYLDLDSDSDT